MIKKICQQYYFSLEGETEKWYFEHLQRLINNTDEISFKVSFVTQINKSIISRAKSIPAIYKKTKAFHICDYESNEEIHVKQFNKVLEELKNVKKINKNIEYELGYSNFSFDLWIILHKIQYNGFITNRNQYIHGINKAYNEKFASLAEYKEKDNFKRILSKISLDDVIRAVNNGNRIRKMNEQNSKDNYRKYGQFEYYIENPDLTINKCVEKILKECGVIVN
ncbi:MAG: RloB domain-containing protein [Clostridia bacterium]|nr:RloB domain-containing protein [Clostridia bacterium]